MKTVRSAKGVSFIQLSDGSCFADLQIVADPALVPEGVTTGGCLSVAGELVASPGSGQAVELTHSYCRSDYYDFVAEMRR